MTTDEKIEEKVFLYAIFMDGFYGLPVVNINFDLCGICCFKCSTSFMEKNGFLSLFFRFTLKNLMEKIGICQFPFKSSNFEEMVDSLASF